MKKITIKQRQGSIGPMTGLNTEIYIDGQMLDNVVEASFSIQANGIGITNLKLVGPVEIEGNLDYDRVVMEEYIQEEGDEANESTKS